MSRLVFVRYPDHGGIAERKVKLVVEERDEPE